MPKKKHNPYELSEWEKRQGYHQITIQEALESLGGGNMASCEPLYDGSKYVNCEKCKVKECCQWWQEYTKLHNFYSESGEE